MVPTITAGKQVAEKAAVCKVFILNWWLSPAREIGPLIKEPFAKSL